jgi:hypothetical protein
MSRVRAVRGLQEDRGTRSGDRIVQMVAEMNEGLSPFYRIERQVEMTGFRREVRFVVLDMDGETDGVPGAVATIVSVRQSMRDRGWHIHPGSTTSQIPAIEALARGYALTVASYECGARSRGDE